MNYLQAARDILKNDDSEITNAFGIGQVQTTYLAEQIVIDFNLDPRMLEDETHPEHHNLWDAVIDAATEFEDAHGIPH